MTIFAIRRKSKDPLIKKNSLHLSYSAAAARSRCNFAAAAWVMKALCRLISPSLNCGWKEFPPDFLGKLSVGFGNLHQMRPSSRKCHLFIEVKFVVKYFT